MISVSVPGKIHLLGEHAVVYGKPALLLAIKSKVHLKITPTVSLQNKTVMSLRGAAGDVAILFNPDPGKVVLPAGRQVAFQDDRRLELLRKTIEETIQKKFSLIEIPQYRLEINSELPIGSGLGSSAAISVGLTQALLKFLKIKTTKKVIFEIALTGENLFHGNASGADVATVLYGGLVYFKKDVSFKKSITPLKFKINKKLQQFILIDSGKPTESTKEMVGIVAKNLNPSSSLRGAKRRGNLVKIFDHQEILTNQLVEVLKNGDEEKLMEIIKKGEKNLEELGVVSKSTQKIIRQIETFGGAAKISGAGGVKTGSGILLVYHKNPKVILDFAKGNNLKIYE